jgi:hypothetical protein
MSKRLAASVVTLIYEATLKSFWRRNALSRFLRQAGISQSFISSWGAQESKRQFLDRLFATLPDQPMGQDLLLAIAHDLAQQDVFPDLLGWEDSELKMRDARAAVAALRSGVARIDEQVESARDRQRSRAHIQEMQRESQRSRETLDSLAARLTELASRIGTQQAGYDFQAWFYDLMDFFEVVNRRPYVTAGRQIDGSVTVSGTTYLVELKFTTAQAGATDIDTVIKKISDKADNTMGIMVSMSGYSEVAIAEASGRRTPLMLMDHRHVYFALGGSATFGEIVDRVRRHASQTGEALLPPERFGGS